MLKILLQTTRINITQPFILINTLLNGKQLLNNKFQLVILLSVHPFKTIQNTKKRFSSVSICLDEIVLILRLLGLAYGRMNFGMIVINDITVFTKVVLSDFVFLEVKLLILPPIFIIHKFLEANLLFLIINKLGNLIFSLDFLHY